MTNHTRGPWSVGEERSWEVFDGTGDLIAYCYVVADGERKGQSQCNARLIAAAPDMLVTLERVSTALSGMDAGDLDAAALDVRNAIAKAKGEDLA